jgi:outer membrane protein OmpA-like peptidoglycan-associated protein
MASGRGPSVDGGKGPSRHRLGLASLALLVALGACSPVETYRNLKGNSKNDPNPATTPNTKNLAAGGASSYPNLATVPPPPSEEMSTVDLQHLTQSLVADRANAKYSDQQLRAGLAEAGVTPPQSVPEAPAAGAAPADAASGASRAAAPAAVPMPAAKTSAPAAPTGAGAEAAAGPASQARVATAAPQPGGATGKPAAAATGKPAAADVPGAPSGMASGLRKPGQPPEPGPMESSLVSPQIAETPQPQQLQPAPAPPRMVSMPPANNGGAAHLAPPPAAVPLPPLGAAAAYQPPPSLPTLASPAPTQTAMAAPAGKKPAPPAPVTTTVAEIAFAAGSLSVGDDQSAALDKVAALYRRNPGNLRVVGYAAVEAGASDPMSSFRTALDRARAVASALAKTGIPAGKIAVEAAPATAAGGADRAEVQLLH